MEWEQVGPYMRQDTNNDDLEKQLQDLFRSAQAACDRGESTSDFEAAFVALVVFVKEHPESRPLVEKMCIAGLRDRSLCWELISFCMHALRMATVRDEARRLIDPQDPRGWGPLSSIVEAFDDDWEDADMYAYFRASTETGDS